jgi:uncharacterized membrane protein YfcA
MKPRGSSNHRVFDTDGEDSMNSFDAQEQEKTAAPRFARFGPLDQLDWLIIILAVLAGTVAKQSHFLSLPARFLDWALPLLLIAAGYELRRCIEAALARHRQSRQSGSE